MEEHYNHVVRAIQEGDLVPFLGAGANMCGRLDNSSWKPNESSFLPNAVELSSYLAKEFDFIGKGKEKEDLIRVSQYVSVMRGRTPLVKKLQEVFLPETETYSPNNLHKFLANIPNQLRTSGKENPYQLIVTTNYDTLLEKAFNEQDEKYHLVTYETRGGRLGQNKFYHYPPDSSEPIPIEKPNEYVDLPIKTNNQITETIILKIHGAVQKSFDESSFVITEDDYIEYLSAIAPDISKLLPKILVSKLKNSNKLFLGYGLRDWNMRAILHQIWKEQMEVGDYVSWAIQMGAETLDRKSWQKRNVEILNESLDRYVDELKNRLTSPNIGGTD